MHGGGYHLGSAKAYRNFVGQIASRAGMVAFSVDYRLAPEHVFPAAVEDSLAAYRGLAREGFEKLVVAGDSAGGGLALVLAESKTERRPSAGVLLSPWTDLTGGAAAKAGSDFVLNKTGLGESARRYP